MAKKAISEKSKKSEVIEAYHDLLQQLKTQKETPQQTQKLKEEKKVIENTQNLSQDSIVKSLAELKLTVAKNLENLENQLLQQFSTYQELNKSVLIAKQELENIHQITAEAHSLEALIEAQSDAKQKFDDEMEHKQNSFKEEIEAKRKEWEQEQVEQTYKLKQEKAKAQTQWEREEEEYQYERDQQRKQEEATYQEIRISQEKELAQTRKEVEQDIQKRQKEMQEKEHELVDLKDRVEQFPTQLAEAVKQAESKTRKEIEDKYQFQIERASIERQNEQKLYEQQVETLKTKITEQQELIQKLSDKADQATKQVEQIAVRAIDGAAKSPINLSYPNM